MELKDRLLTREEMADYLQISLPTLKTFLRKGMPKIKVGRQVRFEKEEVVKWFKENKIYKK